MSVILLSIFGGMTSAYTGYYCYNRYKKKQMKNYKERAYYNLEYGFSGLYPQYEPLQTNINST